MRIKVYIVSYIPFCFHVMISVAQTDETDRRTILQQLLNNIGKTVTTDKLIRELNSITKNIHQTLITQG